MTEKPRYNGGWGMVIAFALGWGLIFYITRNGYADDITCALIGWC